MSLSHEEQVRLDPDNLKPGPYVGYMVRRETHSSRAILSIVIAIITLALMIYLLIEGILGMLGKKPLLLSWSQMAHNVSRLPQGIHYAALLAIAVAFLVLGLFLLAKAFLPGPLNRHSIDDKRGAYIVDDAVIASAISHATRKEAGLDKDQVSTEVRRRTITTTVTPTSGIPLDSRSIQTSIEPTMQQYNLRPQPKLYVKIREAGVVNK